MAAAVGTGTPGGSGSRAVCGIRLRNATVSYRMWRASRSRPTCTPISRPTSGGSGEQKSAGTQPRWVDRRLRGINETATSVDEFDDFARDARRAARRARLLAHRRPRRGRGHRPGRAPRDPPARGPTLTAPLAYARRTVVQPRRDQGPRARAGSGAPSPLVRTRRHRSPSSRRSTPSSGAPSARSPTANAR